MVAGGTRDREHSYKRADLLDRGRTHVGPKLKLVAQVLKAPLLPARIDDDDAYNKLTRPPGPSALTSAMGTLRRRAELSQLPRPWDRAMSKKSLRKCTNRMQLNGRNEWL